MHPYPTPTPLSDYRVRHVTSPSKTENVRLGEQHRLVVTHSWTAAIANSSEAEVIAAFERGEIIPAYTEQRGGTPLYWLEWEDAYSWASSDLQSPTRF